MSARLVLACLALAAPILSLGCGDEEPALVDAGICTPPSAVTVSCEPLPEGSTEEGCSGLAFGLSPVPGGDEDTVWPLGCEVSYPYCLGADPASVAECFCLEGSAPGWDCPQ